MKLKIATVSALILFAATVPALGKKYPPRLFQLREDVIVNGALVPPGVYTLLWEAQGSEVSITLQKDGKFVAGAEGTFVNGCVRYNQDAAVLLDNPDGTKSLIEIRIGDTAKAIVLASRSETVHYSAVRRSAAGVP